ncbi:MAG: hypothetical protein GYA21_08895 [Myxococcales bacterium]|nr:hypothetical protein [Myxococcales bacterium]
MRTTCLWPIMILAGLSAWAVGCQSYSTLPADGGADAPDGSPSDADGVANDGDGTTFDAGGDRKPDGDRPDAGRDGGPDGGDDGGITRCPLFIGALAECAFQYLTRPAPGSCPETLCEQRPCKTDTDCPQANALELGPYCVTGDCVYCWNDTGCPAGSICRAGRCVEPIVGCPPAPPCTDSRCFRVAVSEASCPVCVCDTIFDKPCASDEACLVYSSHYYPRCVYGRCADCRHDADCPTGTRCLHPGWCAVVDLHPSILYGTWVVGISAGLEHRSYIRFEPGGVLRRGSYTSDGITVDDIPPFPCTPAGGIPAVTTGTWEVDMVQSTWLVIRASLNIACDSGAGWTGRYRVTRDSSGSRLIFQDIDSGLSLDAWRARPGACRDDMASCELPRMP